MSNSAIIIQAFAERLIRSDAHVNKYECDWFTVLQVLPAGRVLLVCNEFQKYHKLNCIIYANNKEVVTVIYGYSLDQQKLHQCYSS
jgi:hypothetical protein